MFNVLYCVFFCLINLDILSFFGLFLGLAILFSKSSSLQRKGRALALIATLILGVLNLSPLGPWMLMHLENEATVPTLKPGEKPKLPENFEGIIVLGGSLSLSETRERGEPVHNLAGTRVFQAVATAVELNKKHPHFKIVLTGNKLETDEARTLFKQAGFTDDRFILDRESKATGDHPRLLKPFLTINPNAPYILITSAFHMKRSRMLFESAGIPVSPYPVDYHTPSKMSQMFWISSVLQRLTPIAFKQSCLEWAGITHLKFSS